MVADAYGLSREQYAHVLSTFSHRSYPRAPELCLACYDELKAIGVEAFTRKYDPYWDIPLNENLPEPVIDLPSPKDITEEEQLPILVAAQAATEVVTVERPTKLRESRERDSDVSPTDRHVLLLCRVIDKHRGTLTKARSDRSKPKRSAIS